METYTEFFSGLVYHAFKLLTIIGIIVSFAFTIYCVYKAISVLLQKSEKDKPAGISEVYPYTCVCCSGPFKKGGIIQDDKFCKSCLENYRHFDYYHDQGISDKQVYEITEEQTEL